MAYEVNLETGEEVAAQIERWKPPLVVDRPSKKRVAETFQTIVTACMKVGIPISDKRAV